MNAEVTNDLRSNMDNMIDKSTLFPSIDFLRLIHLVWSWVVGDHTRITGHLPEFVLGVLGQLSSDALFVLPLFPRSPHSSRGRDGTCSYACMERSGAFTAAMYIHLRSWSVLSITMSLLAEKPCPCRHDILESGSS